MEKDQQLPRSLAMLMYWARALSLGLVLSITTLDQIHRGEHVRAFLGSLEMRE
jgi:hypothetical protein